MQHYLIIYRKNYSHNSTSCNCCHGNQSTPAHCARATIQYLRQATPDLISPDRQPRNSPNLNLINYRIWGRLWDCLADVSRAYVTIYYRIQFKIALLMYNALAGRCPEYINDIVAPVASNPGRKQLRSATRSDVIVPRCRPKFGSRAFSVAGPDVWNRLPQPVRSADTVRQFRRLLKTHYFQLHFGPN